MEEFFNRKDESGNTKVNKPSTFQKLQKLIAEKLKRLYFKNIPDDSIQEMQPIFVRTYGPIAYATTFALFSFFAYLSYSSNINQSYISLTFDRRHCSTVPIKVTNSFYADKNGNWMGSSGFRYSNVLYQLDLNGFSISDIAQYEDMMRTFNADILRIGNTAKTRNLAFNLLLWTTYSRYYSLDSRSLVFSPTDSMKGGLQQFQMTGDAKQVFDLKYQAVRVMSFAGYCPIIPSTSYSRDSGIISGSISALDFMADPVCNYAFNPESMGWNQNFDGYNFTLGLDVQSFVIAMSVNLGYISLDSLEIAQNLDWQFTTPAAHDDAAANNMTSTYEANFYYDMRYPTMKLILCLRNTTAVSGRMMTALCVLQLNEIILGLPIFNSNGMFSPEQGWFVPCNCSVIETDSSLREYCDSFNFLSGYLFYNIYNPADSAHDNLGSQLLVFATVITKYPGYAEFNNAMQDAMQLMSILIAFPVYYSFIPQFLIEYFLWPCFVLDTGCSLVMFQSYDYINKQVSEYHYQLSNGSCSDSFSIPTDKWQLLVDKPPAKFYQDYYTCYPDTLSTVQAAVGVAAGNMSVTVPIVLAILLPLAFLVLQWLDKVPLKDAYSKEDEAAALQVVAGMMLRLRDGRAAGLHPDGTLAAWYSELAESAQTSLYRELMHHPIDEQKQEEEEEFEYEYDDGVIVHQAARVVDSNNNDVVDYNQVYFEGSDDL